MPFSSHREAVRRVIPPLRLGNFSIDLGFMVLLFVVYVLMNVVNAANPNR